MEAQPYKLRMDPDEVRRLARERLGVHSNRAIAEKAGVDVKTLFRAMTGRGQPNGQFIATVLRALDANFDEVFAIIPMAEADQNQQLAA